MHSTYANWKYILHQGYILTIAHAGLGSLPHTCYTSVLQHIQTECLGRTGEQHPALCTCEEAHRFIRMSNKRAKEFLSWAHNVKPEHRWHRPQ